jgi:hypothetical protein
LQLALTPNATETRPNFAMHFGIATLDSITTGGIEHRNLVVVTGSHGGNYAAFCAARLGVRGAIFNDAGVGKDAAGIAGLALLNTCGVPAATVDHDSARIGDGHDALVRGRISHWNEIATHLGCFAGANCLDAARRMLVATDLQGSVPDLGETRTVVLRSVSGHRVICIDSGSLVVPEDAGQVLVIGSHGGLPGGRPEAALKVNTGVAVFHDAGVGIDQAGISRLEALQGRGIAAATVDGSSARIGDGRSLYHTGIISHVNANARRWGGAPGQSTRQFAAAMLVALASSAGA